ncbi:MAG: hypothetical protein MUF45_07975 [Spirosomaceae bacterium]|jgi:hypothetical protein|nr:hypothetical protein [Spirosomataceae bacterium]
MNELEKMKELWRDIYQNQNQNSQLDKKQIMENLSKKSNGIFAKLQKSVWLEYIISAVCLPIILIWAPIYNRPEIKFASVVFCLTGVVLLVILWKDLRKIQLYSANIQNLKESINQSVIHMEYFVKLYFKVYMFLWPMVGIVYYYMYNYFAKKDELNLMVLIGFVVVCTTIGYFIQKWYTDKMYGRYLKELKKLKMELEKDEY